MSKYIGEFLSINNIPYKIEITTSTGSKNESVILAETPLTTQMDSEGDTIYSPIKCTGATITILTDSMPLDIYSGSAKGTNIKVTSQNKVIWTGYLTPCCYDMGYNQPLEEVELECVDGISVLKNFPYLTEKTTVKPFAEIIFNCLKISECFKNLYITNNVQLALNTDISIIEKFRISEQNFFEEKDDINQSDADVAWNCYDVIFEIMQYLGYTLFADGEDVYVIDYDAIKRGNNKYFKYDLTGSTIGNPESVELKYSYTITGNSISETGTKISLDTIYNKVSVKDDFYTYETLFQFPDINFEENITPKIDNGLTDGHYVLKDILTDKVDGNKEETYQIMVVNGWRNRKWVVVFKFYKSGFLSFEKYSATATRENKTEIFENSTKFSDMLNYHGAFYARYFKKEINGDFYNRWRAEYSGNFNSLPVEKRKEAWIKLINKNPEGVEFKPIIVCMNQPTYHIGPAAKNRTGNYNQTDDEDCRRYPYIKLKGEHNANILGGKNAYVIISADWSYHDEYKTPFPLSDGADNKELKRGGDYKHASQGFVWARFKWGPYYWNGSDWVSNPDDFKLWFWDIDKDRGDRKNKATYDKNFPLLDTASAKFACKDKGYYIPAPQAENLAGSIDFIIYANRDMKGDSRRSHWHPSNGDYYSRYYQYVTFFKDLKIKSYIANGFLDDKENESDTVYTNIIDNGSVDELGEITFKVCTFDNKKPTYSSVDYLVNETSQYVKKTVNKALASVEQGSISAFDYQTGLTQEEHLIFKLVKQYESPKVVYECNLHNDEHKLYGLFDIKTFSGKKFIATEINTDFRMNKSEIKLIEKF